MPLPPKCVIVTAHKQWPYNRPCTNPGFVVYRLSDDWSVKVCTKHFEELNRAKHGR